MKHSIRFFAFLLCFLLHIALHAQDPVNWSFSSKKVGDKLYEVHLTAEVEGPWHIYSQFSPAGGALPTSITINRNPLVLLQGSIRENGKMNKKFEEVFGMEVKYYEGSVTFIQIVRLKASVKTNFSGNLEFMVCNDRECLPPKKVSFNIPLQ